MDKQASRIEGIVDLIGVNLINTLRGGDNGCQVKNVDWL